MRMERNRDAVIAGLIELANWLEANPALDIPNELTSSTLSIFAHSRERLAEHIAAFGGGEKFSETWGTGLRRWFGGEGGIRVDVSAPRSEVCERHVVGTKIETVPDPAAPMVEREVEVVEWVCPESLLNLEVRIGERI